MALVGGLPSSRGLHMSHALCRLAQHDEIKVNRSWKAKQMHALGKMNERQNLKQRGWSVHRNRGELPCGKTQRDGKCSNNVGNVRKVRKQRRRLAMQRGRAVQQRCWKSYKSENATTPPARRPGCRPCNTDEVKSRRIGEAKQRWGCLASTLQWQVTLLAQWQHHSIL